MQTCRSARTIDVIEGENLHFFFNLLVHKGFSTLGDSGGVLTMLDSGIAVISHDVWFNGYRWGSAALYPVSMVSGISFTSPDSSGPCCAAASSCLPWGRGAGPWMPGFLAGRPGRTLLSSDLASFKALRSLHAWIRRLRVIGERRRRGATSRGRG